MGGSPYILYLPEVALEKIFSFLTYDEIAKNRIACLSVDNPQKVLILGMSKDFGTCKSVKKNGEQCNAIVNKNQCEFCIYHIKQEYQKCSKRSELQANFAGRGLTALRNKVLGKNEVFYAGKSYMAIPAKKSRKLEIKDNNRLQSLSGTNENFILNKKSAEPTKSTAKKKNAARLDVSPAQKLRDLELLKKLGGCSGIEAKNTFTGKHSANISLEESKNMAINVIDNLKSKNTKMGTTFEVQIKSDSPKGNNIPERLSCSKNNLENDNLPENKSHNSHKYPSPDKLTCNNFLTTATKDSNCRNNPVLSNTYIDLNTPVTPKQMNRAKLNAIKFVQKLGGIKKVDPNSTKGSGKKRAIEEVDKDETASKKSKLAESEFISDRFKKMMEATSKHQDLIEMRHDEEREKYFNKLEIKEKMEEKMINTHKVACKAVRCLKCKYTSFSASDLCKNEKHPLKVFDAMKKFFKCGDCGNRTVSLEIIPVEPCKNCGSGKWQKAGMMKDKTVLTHSLSIRGGEQKFVNSVATDANINLMVPE